MPDRLGMDHLGGSRRCIDCEASFRPWEQAAMEAHFRVHERERKRDRSKQAAAQKREATARLRQLNRLRREARA